MSYSLWILKAALLSFYSRFVRVTSWGKIAVNLLWCLLLVSCLVVIVAILAECRPMSLYVALVSLARSLLTVPGCGDSLLRKLVRLLFLVAFDSNPDCTNETDV